MIEPLIKVLLALAGISAFVSICIVLWDQLRKQIDDAISTQAKELEEVKLELKITEQLWKDRQRVLDAIPECPLHGSCVTHALEWIEKQKLNKPI